MSMRTWARLSGSTVAELIVLDAGLLPGTDVPALWTDDVTAVPNIAVGWTKSATGTFAAPVVPPPTAAQLVAYANARQWAMATGGYTVVIGGQSLTFATDTISQGLIAGKVLRLQQPNPPATIDWQLATGFVTLAAADFITTATKIADAVQATFEALKTVLAGIQGGSITTTAQIDTAFAAVT